MDEYLITKESETPDYLISEDKPESQGLGSKVKDVAVSFGTGANSLLQMAGDLYGLATGDMENVVSRQARENIEYLQKQKSPELQKAEQERRKAIDAEEDELGKALSYVRLTATNPLLLSSAIGEQIPNLVGTGGAGALAKKGAEKLLLRGAAEQAAKRAASKKAASIGVGAAVGTGAAMQGTDVASDLYDEAVRSLDSISDEQAMSIPEIAEAVEERGATVDEAKAAFALTLGRQAFAVAAPISAASQMLPGGRTIERAFVGKQAAKPLAGALAGAVGEAASEAVEEGGSKVAANILARKFEPERPIARGVGEAVGQAALMGGIPGAAAGAASRPSQSVSEGTQTAGMSDEAPTSAAISPSLEERPTVDLSKAEELNQDQFFAAINVRQANLLGGEPNPEDVKIVGEITSRAQIDPEKANAAVSAAQEAVSAWSEQNENAPTNIRVIYDPGMAQNGYGIRGAFNRRTGEILINAAYATSPEIVEEVARHEWAHQTLASPEGQKAIVDFAAQAIPAEELADLSRRYGTEDKMVLVDEWIANNAEKAPGVIARIVQYIREWLSEFTNGAVKLSPQEAANVLLRTLREQQTGRVEPETVREEGTRMSLEKTPVAERRQEAFEAFKAANPRSDAVMEGGRLYSPAVRNRLKNLLATGEVDRRALDREVERNIPAARNVEIPTEENLPSLEEIRAAVDQSQRSKVGGASNIPAGDSVTVRQDVPAFSRYGVGVVTVQDSKGNKYYQPFVRFTEPVLKPTSGMEKASLKIGAGEAKTPTIVARGKMSEDQSLPADLDTWTQVGYNPDRHSYMYDRATGRPVTGGSEAVQIGNTVFVKDPKFGEKGDFLYSLAQTKTPEFKKWFGESKIVEPDGTPAVMYHGTFFRPRETYLGGRTEDFTVFRPQVQEGFMGEKVEGDPGLIFVTPDPQFASSFAGTADDTETGSLTGDALAERRPGARVYPLFVKAENPFDYNNPDHVEKLFGGKPSLDVPTGDGRIKRIYPSMLEQGRWHVIEPLAGLIKEAGFDGLYVNEQSTKNLAVFSPNQLKSATGNVGAFGQRPLTAEERERVGVSEEAAEGLQRAGDIRFSLTPEQQEAINDKKVRELDIPKLVKEGILTERYAELLQNLLETSGEGSETRIEVWGPGGMPPRAAGVYRGADDVIMISSGTKLDLGRVLLHEYVHALTITGLKYAEGVYTNTGDMILAKPRPGVDIKELRDASRDMYKLLAEARKAAAETKQEFYGFTNREEFVAEAFSNLKFQQFLSSIPSIRNKKKSLFDEFISIVKRIVGLSEDSLLTDVIAATDTLVGATRERVGTLVSDDFELPENTRFSLEKERTVEDQMKAMTTVKGPLKADSEGYLPEYITTEEALPTVVGGKNKTISVPFVSYNQYANTYFKSVSRDPRYAGKTVSLANVHAKVMQEGYSGFSAETYLEKDLIKAADMIVNDMAENLLFLHDLATEVFGANVAKRMSKWYDGARVIAENLAKKYDISVSQSAAVLASLSPQKHWFANVSLAENVMDVLKNHQETVFDADVEKAALKSLDESSGTPASKEILYRLIKEVSGKKLSELSDPDQIAFFTRFLSQYIHPSQAYIVTPEGKLTPGSSVAVAWSSLDITKNAIAAFLDGSVENLTAAIGGGHKVRNFYGNIRDPNSPLFYTSDTHNVAAALLIPLGGTAFEVTHNFGSNQDKGVDGPRLPVIGTTIIGLQGTYAMYVEAGRRAAEKRGILPRQMQSITWETVRILFPDDSKTKELIKEIKGIHAKVKEGKITLADARNEIVERMGGIEGIKARPPEWLNQ